MIRPITLSLAHACGVINNYGVDLFNTHTIGNHCMPTNVEGKGGADQGGL